MGDYFRPFSIKYYLIILLFSSLNSIAQTEYTKFDLIGKGGIPLVGKTHRLQEETKTAFLKMQKDALKEGVSIQIVSAYRSFNAQKNIWNRKYRKFISEGYSPEKAIAKIIEYSTLPGTSRHHWGTDFDIVDRSKPFPKRVLTVENYSEENVYSKLKNWMNENSEKYGFYLVYTNDVDRKGFKYEPWHYSYKPLSKKCLYKFLEINLVEFFESIELSGSEYITQEFLIKYFQENILDINPVLK